MPESYLKKKVKLTKPQTTAAELIECVQTYDLGTREGKRELWRLLGRLPPFHKSEVERLRDKYLSQRFHIRDANRMAALDIAAGLPTAHELPTGLWDSLRLVPSEKEAKGGKGAYAARLEAEAAARDSKLSGNVEMLAGVPPSLALPPDKPAPRKRPPTMETQFERLLIRVREQSEGARVGIGRSVAWVSANLGLPLDRIQAEDVPGAEALSLYQWARQNETEYRRLYDSKRIPTRGIAEDEEKGFIDTGDPIEDIIDRIRDGLQKGSTTDVSMRHLQATEPDGDVNRPAGGVHDLPERPVAGRESCAPGRDGGSGSDPDGEAGVDIHGPNGAGPGLEDDGGRRRADEPAAKALDGGEGAGAGNDGLPDYRDTTDAGETETRAAP